MKTGIVIYDGFVHFEISLLSYLMNSKGTVVTIAKNLDEVTSEEGFKIKPHETISESIVDELDVLIVPGGSEKELIHDDELKTLIKKFNDSNKVIGAICSAVLVLAETGILNGSVYTSSIPEAEFEKYENMTYVDVNVVTSNNIITAKANGYVDFAIEVGAKMDIYDDKDDLNETIDFFRNFKSL